MPHTETCSRPARARFPGSALKAMGAAFRAFRIWRRTVRRRRAIADLPPELLKDIGCSEGCLPAVEVKPGLITNLMSMK